MWEKIDFENIIEKISERQEEEKWLKKLRYKALKLFFKNKEKDKVLKSIEKDIDFNDFKVFVPEPSKAKINKIPKEIEEIYNYLNINEIEKNFFAGTSIQKDSSLLHYNIKKEFLEKGAIILPLEVASKEHKKLVKKYLGKIGDLRNPRNALNLALMSGGLFIYIPRDLKIPLPFYAYFTMKHENIGQFERTLMVLEKNSEFYYIEGCAAPLYRKYSFHLGAMEALINKNVKGKFVTLQNWSKNIVNAPYKYLKVEKNAKVEWIDINIGSKKSIKKPNIIVKGEKATILMKSVSSTKENQIHIGGGNIVLKGKKSRAYVSSKSIVHKNAINIFDNTLKASGKKCIGVSDCDTLLLDKGEVITIPELINNNKESEIAHEARTSFFNDEIKEYFFTKGINIQDALKIISVGYVEEELAQIPLDIAIEFKKLLELEIERGIG